MSIKVYGVGRISTDLELKATTSNISFVNFNLAVDGSYKDETTYFHKVIAWRLLGENLVKFCKKGSKVFVEGHLTERSYESDKGTRYITEIVADNITYLDNKDTHPRTDEEIDKTSKLLASEEDLPFD